jgi:hypothetical protein
MWNYTGCSNENAAQITTVFVNSGDVNIVRQTSCSVLFYLLGKTYRTALQQTLKMSCTFWKKGVHPMQSASREFSKRFCVNADNSLFNMVFHFLQASWSIQKKISLTYLWNQHRKSPTKSEDGHISRRKHILCSKFCYQSMYYPIRYFLVRKLVQKRFAIIGKINVRKRIHVPIVNTTFSHRQMRSGLATTVTLNPVSRGGLQRLLYETVRLLISFLTVVRGSYMVEFKWYILNLTKMLQTSANSCVLSITLRIYLSFKLL